MGNISTEIITHSNEEYLKVTLDEKDYELPFKLIANKKVAYLDISGRVSFVESAANEIVQKLNELGIEYDAILNPVSKSNAFAHSISLKWAQLQGTEVMDTVVARKSSTSHKVKASYRSVTTPTDQILSLTDEDAEFIKGKNVLVVDDVYGAGGTTRVLSELVNKAGGNIVANVVIGVEEGGTLPENLIYLFTLPVL